VKKLVLNGYLTLRREGKRNKVVPVSTFVKEDEIAMWIFIGQLDDKGVFL